MPDSLGGRNALYALMIAALMLLGVVVLWLFARDAPSSGIGEIAVVPRASITVSGGCQNFADYWLDETSVDRERATHQTEKLEKHDRSRHGSLVRAQCPQE